MCPVTTDGSGIWKQRSTKGGQVKRHPDPALSDTCFDCLDAMCLEQLLIPFMEKGGFGIHFVCPGEQFPIEVTQHGNVLLR
eukprot:9767910-Prorocentrum_lima.AAC.1